MKTTTDIRNTAQQILDAYYVDVRKYGVPSSLAEVCRVLAKFFVPHEDIDALPSHERVAAKQRVLTRTQLLVVAWELERLDRADKVAYAEQVVTGEPDE